MCHGDFDARPLAGRAFFVASRGDKNVGVALCVAPARECDTSGPASVKPSNRKAGHTCSRPESSRRCCRGLPVIFRHDELRACAGLARSGPRISSRRGPVRVWTVTGSAAPRHNGARSRSHRPDASGCFHHASAGNRCRCRWDGFLPGAGHPGLTVMAALWMRGEIQHRDNLVSCHGPVAWRLRTVVSGAVHSRWAASAPCFDRVGKRPTCPAPPRHVRQIAENIVSREGGYVNDPDDPGGATNFGVTIGTMQRLGLDLTGDGKVTVADVRRSDPGSGGRDFHQPLFPAAPNSRASRADACIGLRHVCECRAAMR